MSRTPSYLVLFCLFSRRRIGRAITGGCDLIFHPERRLELLEWKLKRLRAMEIPEMFWRMRRSAQDVLERLRCSVGRIPGVPAPRGRSGRCWVDGPLTDIDAGPYTYAGERILSGCFDIFALRSAQLGFPPAWNKDPKTGVHSPMVFGAMLDYRSEAVVGNIKYLWELNRHLEVVTLSQAFHLTGDARFALGARELLDSWCKQCPYPWGPNWTSPLEHAVRLVNWSCSWHLLGAEDSLLFKDRHGTRFKRDWLKSIYRHLRFIRRHLSRYSSANNHLLGEYMGLFIGTTTWPLWSVCDEWNALAKNGLEREALRQNGTDGVNREQAIWYEHEALDMLLLCGLMGRANGLEFSKAYWNRLVRVLEHFASVMDVSGQVPMFGDSDDAVMVRFSQERDFNSYQSLLATGAVLFNRSDLKLKAKRFDDKSRWLLGDEAAARFEALPARAASLPVRRAFPEGGYWILGDKLDTRDEVRLIADAGPLGYLSIAAHGHADALSFTLSLRGQEMLVDPGTYAYHTQRKWRDYFRGTSAHNTVRVAGEDQSLAGGSFLWSTHACAECHRFESSAERDEWEASHDGYLRLAEPVRHRRRIVLDKRAERIEVIDVLEGSGRHSVELFWHFAEDCRVVRDGVCFRVHHGKAALWLQPPPGLRARLISAVEEPPLGWISRRFDEKTPTVTVLCEGTLEAGVTVCTVLHYGDSELKQTGMFSRHIDHDMTHGTKTTVTQPA